MVHKCAQLEETFQRGYSGLPFGVVNPPETWITWEEMDQAFWDKNPETVWPGPMFRIGKGLAVPVSFCPFCGENLLSNLTPTSVSRITKTI